MEPDFAGALARCVARIPKGRVVACADLARALGDVRAAKAVAAWIRDHPDVPETHRIVRSDRVPLLREARTRLEAEGVRLRQGRVPAARIGPPPRAVPVLAQLRAEQRRLSRRVSEVDEGGRIRLVAGADVAYADDIAHAVAVSWDVDAHEATEIVESTTRVDFPYIPTYLGFRELPAIRAAVTALRERPDILLVDGHGRLHPVLFGFACYAGVSLDLPTIGVAKHSLVGRPRPSERRGDAVPIAHQGAVRGVAWTPPGGARPCFISVGHRISLETAVRTVRDVTIRSIPEPLRLADQMSKKRKDAEKRERGSGS